MQTMSIRMTLGLGLAVLWGALSRGTLGAAEIRLRAEVRVAGPIVRLGDVAEISGAELVEAGRLAGSELGPAPAGGRALQITARQVQDTLALAGLSLAKHTLSGASRVTVSSAAATPPQRIVAAGDAAHERALELLRGALMNYLVDQSGDSDWVCEFSLDETAVRWVQQARGPLRVSGGVAPWEGNQTFSISAREAVASAPLMLTTDVSRAAQVVVLVRAVGRGDRIGPGDVQLARAEPGQRVENAFRSVDDAVGREATRAMAPGQLLTNEAARSPRLVRRGEPVTVYARAAGLQVHTVGTAKEEGGLGDVITVESRLSRQIFLARITGPQEAEVYAHALSVAGQREETRAVVASPARRVRSRSDR